MYCSKCGKSLPEGSRFCTLCGQPVEGNATGNTVNPVTPSYSVENKVFSKEGLFCISGRRNRKPYFWTNFLFSFILNGLDKAAIGLKLASPEIYILAAVELLFAYLASVNVAKRL